MGRAVLVLALAGLALAGRAWGQAAKRLDDLHTKSPITPEDREVIRRWLRPRIAKLVASTDPELKDMVRARAEIVSEGRAEPSWSPEFIRAYGEEAVARLEAADDRAVSPAARINLVMAVADLKRVEAVQFLVKILNGDPYQATRYLASAGLAALSEAVAEQGDLRAEEEISEGVR